MNERGTILWDPSTLLFYNFCIKCFLKLSQNVRVREGLEIHRIYSLDFFRKRKRGPERLNDLPQVTQPTRGLVRAGKMFPDSPPTVLSACTSSHMNQ